LSVFNFLHWYLPASHTIEHAVRHTSLPILGGIREMSLSK